LAAKASERQRTAHSTGAAWILATGFSFFHCFFSFSFCHCFHCAKHLAVFLSLNAASSQARIWPFASFIYGIPKWNAISRTFSPEKFSQKSMDKKAMVKIKEKRSLGG
jgi:hypothetical protein